CARGSPITTGSRGAMDYW
nr:immunoglobulin heavy chain junction region [Mus musculus]